MTRTPNPFRPGFNQAPAVLVGRDTVLAAADEALAIAAVDLRTPPPLLLVGSRGVGKTVLLNEIAGRAAGTYGWPRAHVEVLPDSSFIPTLIERIDGVRGLFEGSPSKKPFRLDAAAVKAQVAGVGGEVRFVRTKPESSPANTLDRALRSAVDAAIDRRTGIVVTIDELQLARRPELAQVASLLQEGTGNDWPIMVVAAGLPAIRRPKSSVTYLERGDWYDVGSLSHEDTVACLVRTADDAGRPFVRGAAATLAAPTGGYPYAVQVFGHHAWRASNGSDRIGRSHVAAAIDAAEQQLERGLYRGRWEQASKREREYLVAIARRMQAGEAVTARLVADDLDAEPRQLSQIRDRLLKKGTITVDGNEMTFAVPGMARFVTQFAASSD